MERHIAGASGLYVRLGYVSFDSELTCRHYLSPDVVLQMHLLLK